MTDSQDERPLREVGFPEVASLLDELYVAAEGAGLRSEDEKKAVEVAAIVREIARAVDRTSRKHELTLVDAAAGKAYVGIVAAKLVLGPSGRDVQVLAIERDPHHAAAACRAASRVDAGISFGCIVGDVAEARHWPENPTIVVALHACGPAADAILERSIAARARHLLLVPCCTSDAMVTAVEAEHHAPILGIPRHAPVRRRFVQAIVDAERTLRLEAAGYETEVVELVPPTVTPHNLLFRARRVGEPHRMAEAQHQLETLRRRVLTAS